MEMQFRRLLNLFVVLFLVVSGVLVYWQVFWPTSAAPSGQDQNNYLAYKPCVASETPQRGNIYDRNGVLLAWSVPDPTELCGWRRRYATDKYPSISSFMGYYSPIYGATGIERFYNDQLAGNTAPADFNDASNQYWNNLLHRPIHGQDLYLSIDIRIQDQVDSAFQKDANTSQVCNDTDGPTQTGSIIVEDPHNGQILAMVSRPYFNADMISDPTPAPDNPNQTIGSEYWNKISHDPCAPLINRAIQGQYVPGSIFKTMTLIAALDSNTYQPTSTFTQAEATSVTVDGELINSNNLDAYGLSSEKPSFPMDLAHAYAYSDNVVFARVGTQMGAPFWLQYARKFYMSTPGNIQTPPIDLKEALPSYAYVKGTSLYPTLLAESSFGQGQLTITPLTMSMITSSVAADGVLYKPHLGLKLVPYSTTASSTVAKSVPNNLNTDPGQQIFSAQTAQYVRLAMKDVVQFGSIQSSGTGWAGVYQSQDNIGGKTGTAQTSGNHPNTWFISLAPDDAYPGAGPAKLTLIVMKEQGTEGAYESLMAPSIYDNALPLVGQ